MANTYKNIVITPNIASNIGDPKIVFSGANNTVNTDITLSVNPSTNGTLSIDGSQQLFSVTNSMVGIHFSVNNANGVPNIEITDAGIIRMAQYSGNVQILGGEAATSTNTGELQVTGGVGVSGNVYANAIYTNGLFYAANGLPISTGSGGSSSGYLNNSVIFANTTGFLSNTANLTFSNTNILRVNGSITLANSLTTNTATIIYNSSNNSIDFIFN